MHEPTILADLRAAARTAARSGACHAPPSDDAAAWLQVTSADDDAASAPDAEGLARSGCRSAHSPAMALAAPAQGHQAAQSVGQTLPLQAGSAAQSSPGTSIAAADSPRSVLHKRAAYAERRQPVTFDCSLCLSSLLEASMACCPCGHVYHHECLQTMLRAWPKCPICEQACQPSAAIKLYL